MRSTTFHIYDTGRSIYQPVVFLTDRRGKYGRSTTHAPSIVHVRIDGQDVPLSTLVAHYKARTAGR